MIPLNTIVQVGPTGLLALVVLMILTGLLVPRRTHKDVLADRDMWREVAQNAMRQNQELLTGARVAHEVIKVLPEAAGERT